MDRGELTKSAQASSTTSTWALPGSLEGPADDLHRIRCGTVDSPLYGWIDYSPAEHTAAGHWNTTTGADGGVLFRRSCSLSVIHTYLHLHLRLQLVFTTSIATSEDGVIIVPYVASPPALLTSIPFYYLTASLFELSPNQVSRLLARLPHPCLSLTGPRHSFPHQRRGQTTKDGQTETQPRLCLTR